MSVDDWMLLGGGVFLGLLVLLFGKAFSNYADQDEERHKRFMKALDELCLK